MNYNSKQTCLQDMTTLEHTIYLTSPFQRPCVERSYFERLEKVSICFSLPLNANICLFDGTKLCFKRVLVVDFLCFYQIP